MIRGGWVGTPIQNIYESKQKSSPNEGSKDLDLLGNSMRMEEVPGPYSTTWWWKMAIYFVPFTLKISMKINKLRKPRLKVVSKDRSDFNPKYFWTSAKHFPETSMAIALIASSWSRN